MVETEVTHVEFHPLRRVVLGTHPSFEAAKQAVLGMGAHYMEDDAEYPGCADAMLKDGRVVAVQPVGFTLSS